jgi:hypothetical protein
VSRNVVFCCGVSCSAKTALLKQIEKASADTDIPIRRMPSHLSWEEMYRKADKYSETIWLVDICLTDSNDGVHFLTRRINQGDYGRIRLMLYIQPDMKALIKERSRKPEGLQIWELEVECITKQFQEEQKSINQQKGILLTNSVLVLLDDPVKRSQALRLAHTIECAR